MNRSQRIRVVVFLLLFPYTAVAGDTCLGADDWTATGLIRAGKYPDAIRTLRSCTAVPDSGYHFLKLGLCSYRMKDQGTALTYLRLATRHTPAFSPITGEMIGDMEHWSNNTEAALTAYRTALESTTRERLQRPLHDKISTLILTAGLDTAQYPWVRPWFKKSAATIRQERLTRLDTLVRRKEWPATDSFLRACFDSADGNTLCSVLAPLFTASVPDTAFATGTLYRIAKAAFSCQNWDLADTWVQRAAVRNNFSAQVDHDDYLMFRASVCARQTRYAEALTWIARFEKQFGPTASSVLAKARALRNTRETGSATSEYQRYLDLFPGDQKTPDIIWYLAWQCEDSNQPAKAAEYYRSLIRRFPRNPKAEESLFRLGLLAFKTGQYDSALVHWSSLQRKFPQGTWSTAAGFWQAKSLLSRAEIDSAQIMLRTIISDDPCNYYAFRSREMLGLTGDTIGSQFGDTLYDPVLARVWLDSISAENLRPRNSEENADFTLGTRLAAVGLIPQAGAYLDELDRSRPEDLLLQYDLASFYARCGAPAQSFRIARRLAWRIPAPYRMQTPLAVYRVMYPDFYSDNIIREAVRNSLNPALVKGVIRQESIFDASIVSPAGAIGLMQIMPQTGRTLAARLREPYTPDSLYNPVTNIRLGASYIRELIDQFDGNVTLAIASYNGGPHNVSLWHSLNRNDAFDVFVEDIAFAETRGYVKKVLANYWTYLQLHKIPDYSSEKENSRGP